MQEGRPVAYASRALTHAETGYAQIEKEMLAILYSIEMFHQWIYLWTPHQSVQWPQVQHGQNVEAGGEMAT